MSKEQRKELIRNYQREYTKRDEEDWNDLVVNKPDYSDILSTEDCFDFDDEDDRRQ